MRILLALLVLCATVAPAASAHRHSTTTLVAAVGKNDSFAISLTRNGKRVTSLPARTYTIVVHDYSSLHNFALGSVTAGKRLFTGSVPGKGTETYRLKLIAGTYAFACSAHPTTMNGHFTVR
jgi:hypothetical protein